MKTASLYLRPFIAIVCFAGLVACGGKSVFTLQGTISGLDADATGLELQNGSEVLAVPASSSIFTFTKPIEYGTSYNVGVKTQPLHVICGVANAEGTAGTTVTSSVLVLCSRNAYALTGTVTGVTADNQSSLLLNNGADSTIAITFGTDATTFTFSQKVFDGSTYGVTVLPSDTSTLNCTIENGAGRMADAPVTNIKVNCVPK